MENNFTTANDRVNFVPDPFNLRDKVKNSNVSEVSPFNKVETQAPGETPAMDFQVGKITDKGVVKDKKDKDSEQVQQGKDASKLVSRRVYGWDSATIDDTKVGYGTDFRKNFIDQIEKGDKYALGVLAKIQPNDKRTYSITYDKDNNPAMHSMSANAVPFSDLAWLATKRIKELEVDPKRYAKEIANLQKIIDKNKDNPDIYSSVYYNESNNTQGPMVEDYEKEAYFDKNTGEQIGLFDDFESMIPGKLYTDKKRKGAVETPSETSKEVETNNGSLDMPSGENAIDIEVQPATKVETPNKKDMSLNALRARINEGSADTADFEEALKYYVNGTWTPGPNARAILDRMIDERNAQSKKEEELYKEETAEKVETPKVETSSETSKVEVQPAVSEPVKEVKPTVTEASDKEKLENSLNSVDSNVYNAYVNAVRNGGKFATNEEAQLYMSAVNADPTLKSKLDNKLYFENDPLVFKLSHKKEYYGSENVGYSNNEEFANDLYTLYKEYRDGKRKPDSTYEALKQGETGVTLNNRYSLEHNSEPNKVEITTPVRSYNPEKTEEKVVEKPTEREIAENKAKYYDDVKARVAALENQLENETDEENKTAIKKQIDELNDSIENVDDSTIAALTQLAKEHSVSPRQKADNEIKNLSIEIKKLEDSIKDTEAELNAAKKSGDVTKQNELSVILDTRKEGLELKKASLTKAQNMYSIARLNTSIADEAKDAAKNFNRPEIKSILDHYKNGDYGLYLSKDKKLANDIAYEKGEMSKAEYERNLEESRKAKKQMLYLIADELGTSLQNVAAFIKGGTADNTSIYENIESAGIKAAVEAQGEAQKKLSKDVVEHYEDITNELSADEKTLFRSLYDGLDDAYKLSISAKDAKQQVENLRVMSQYFTNWGESEKDAFLAWAINFGRLGPGQALVALGANKILDLFDRYGEYLENGGADGGSNRTTSDEYTYTNEDGESATIKTVNTEYKFAQNNKVEDIVNEMLLRKSLEEKLGPEYVMSEEAFTKSAPFKIPTIDKLVNFGKIKSVEDLDNVMSTLSLLNEAYLNSESGTDWWKTEGEYKHFIDGKGALGKAIWGSNDSKYKILVENTINAYLKNNGNSDEAKLYLYDNYQDALNDTGLLGKVSGANKAREKKAKEAQKTLEDNVKKQIDNAKNSTDIINIWNGNKDKISEKEYKTYYQKAIKKYITTAYPNVTDVKFDPSTGKITEFKFGTGLKAIKANSYNTSNEFKTLWDNYLQYDRFLKENLFNTNEWKNSSFGTVASTVGSMLYDNEMPNDIYEMLKGTDNKNKGLINSKQSLANRVLSNTTGAKA